MRKELQSPRPGSRAALKRGGGASSSLVEIVTEERAADDELHESNNNSSLNLGAAQRSANSNTTTTTTTPNNNNKIKNSGASAGLYAATTPNTTSTTPRGGKRSSMTTAPRQKRRGSNNNTTTAVGGGSEGNHHPNNNNNTNNSASTAKGPVSGGGGNNKDMLQSTVRSVAGGVPHYQLHTSASRGASRSLSSTHVRMGFAGRPMAPVVHIRVRPLLPFMGESNDLRRVWFLDHKNMVVRAAARVTDRRQTLPPSKLSPGNSTAAMHPSGSGTAALKGTANNSSLLLGGGGGGSSFALHSPYPYPWGSHTSRAESERSGGSNQPSRSSSPRRNSSCSPPQTSISQHIAIPHAPAGGVGGGKGSQCASGWSTPRARASTLSLTTFKNSSSTRAAAANTSLASPTQAGKNASRSSEHSTPKHSASCLHPTGAAGGRTDSGRAAAAAAGPPPADEVGASCGGTDQHFTFEFIHDEEASQEEVFDESILRFADEALLAQNISILCYGPTGSGKTYSMMGNHPAASLSRRGSTAAVVAGFPQHVNPNNNNNISCTPSPTHARTPSRGGAAGVRRATMPLTPEVDALTPLTAALGGDMGIAALGEDRVSSRRSSSYSVNGKPYGSSASESFTPVSDEDEDEEWPLFDHTWYRNRRHQMQTAAKRQDEAHLMNAGNTTDMGILPRLVRVLLDKRGETLVLEREGLGSASNNSSSNVSSSTGSRTRGGGTTTTTAASRGGGGGTMASSATAVVPRRKMSLTLDELTFYGIEIYVDELFDLMDPGKRPVHNVSDTGGLASLCIGLNEARAKAVRAAQAAAAQHNRNRTATATTAVPPRPTGGGIPIESVDDLRRAYKLARKNRVTSVHARNDTSSRSHAVFILQLGFRLVEEDDYGDDVASAAAVSATAVPSRSRRVYSYVALVDLAGCERIKETQVEGAALREAQYINKSLSALSSVVLALYQRSAHIPYRDSKLTRLLRPCLEGGRVLILVHVAPCSAVDTMHSLKFADQVRHTLVQTHSFAGDSNKRGLRDLFEDLIDPAQGRLEVALGQSQHKLDQLCAEVRLAYLTRTLLGDSFNLGPIMGSASTASGNRSRPREDALDVSFAAPSDQLSMESSMTTPAEPAVSTSTVSPNTDRFPAMPAASKRAYAIRTLVQGHFSPLWASEEDGVEEAIREMKLERDRRVEAARRRTEEEIVRIKSTIDEMSKYNARLAEENASPIPRDPYCLELSKEVKVVNEELLDASKVHQTLQSLVALLRQRVSMQSEIDEGVSADVEEMRQKGLLPPAPGTHSCSSPYHNKSNAITGSPPGTAALTYLQSGVAADAEMREIGCQQVLLSKELSALRLEAACFELGDGIWEGLWARTMRQEFLTAMRVEQALVERVLLDKAALEMVVGDTSSMLSSPTTKSMLPHSASAQSVDRPRRGSLSSATLLSLSTNNNHNTATSSSPLELRERVQAYLDNRPRRPSDSDSIDVFVHATSSAASGGFHHSHRTFNNNNTEFNNSTGNNAATAAAAAAAISAGSSPKLGGSTQTAGTASAVASNTTGGFVCIPNPLQELVTLSAAVNRGEAAEGDSDVLLPPKTANSMLTSPSSSLGQQQNTTTTNTNTNTNNNTTAHNRSSQPPSAARPLSQMPVAQNAAPFVNCYDDEEAMQRVGVKILLEEGIPCEVCCIGDGFESVYTQYLCPVMESGKGTSKQKGEAAASPRGVANEDDVGCEDTEERSDPDLHSHNEDANGKDTHAAPAPMLTSRWGRLRLVRRPRGDGRGRRGGSASGCGGGDDEEGYSYCLEFVFSHRGIPLPPRVREGVIAAAAPHHPRTELEELVDALPVPLDLRRGTTTPASTAVQQSLKEHRLFSIPLDESQLSVDLHLLEAGTTRATPVRIGAHREVIRRTEKDAQVAMELHGVPLSTGSPLTSRAMQNLRAQHATAAAARSISRCSASVPRGGGGGGGTDGADGGAEDAPSSTAYSAAPYHPAGDIVVAKRLMDGGELLLPTSCIVPNKGVCTLLLRFSNRTTSNATRLEAVETIIAGLSGIMPPAVPSAPQQQQQQQQQSAASNGIVPLINGTADVVAAAPTPVTRTRSHSGGGGHHHRRTSSTSSRSGQCKRTMSLSVCERTTGGMDRMVCMYPHVPYILLYPSSTQAGERSSDLSRKKLKPSPSAASHDGEPAVVTGKPTTVVAAGTDDVVVRGSSPEPVRPPGASATISSAAPVSYYKAPSEADTPLSSNTMVRGTGLQVHLHFPGRLTATATTTTISGGGAGSRSRSRAASTAPDATSASASAPTTTEKESTSQYIHYAAATLLQLRSVTVGPFDDTTGGGGGVVGGAPHHRTVTRLGMLLQQLHAFRRSIRAMVKQQIYEAEDIKGDVAMHSSEREMLQGSHHLRDVQLEARQAVGLQVHMTASPPGSYDQHHHHQQSVPRPSTNMLESGGGGGGGIADLRSEVHLSLGRELCSFMVPWTIWQWAHRWPAVERRYRELEAEMLAATGGGGGGVTEGGLFTPGGPQQHSHHHGGGGSSAALLSTAAVTGGSAWSTVALGSPAMDATTESDDELTYSFEYGKWMDESALASINVAPRTVWLPEVSFAQVPSYLAYLHRHHYGHHALTAAADEDC